MLANMASSLILHKKINTTLAKAKALRSYIEPIITRSKEDTTHSRRIVFSYLQNKEAVTELFREVSLKVATRPGGYTRILKTGTRLGDSAEMALIELVDYNENLLGTKVAEKEKASTRRRRGLGKKKATVSELKAATPATKAQKSKAEPEKEQEEVTEPDAMTQEEPTLETGEETTDQEQDNK
jgi:large subunit ribosomal protein L17